MNAMDVHDLVTRAKSGSVSERELDEVALALEHGAGKSTYRLLYVLGRMGSRRHEELVARYLDFNSDGQVAGLAVSILCTQWALGSKYRDPLLAHLKGMPWDVLDEAKQAAITAAGEYLRDGTDCPMLEVLLSVATTDSHDLNRRFATQALARALGEPHGRSVHPPGDEAEAWGADVVQRAAARFASECGP